jgi:hypothetical protein
VGFEPSQSGDITRKTPFFFKRFSLALFSYFGSGASANPALSIKVFKKKLEG